MSVTYERDMHNDVRRIRLALESIATSLATIARDYDDKPETP